MPTLVIKSIYFVNFLTTKIATNQSTPIPKTFVMQRKKCSVFFVPVIFLNELR